MIRRRERVAISYAYVSEDVGVWRIRETLA
jgi:hypothetical protein